MKESIIDIKQLCKNFGRSSFALKEINLTIKAGEIYGIIGSSGAGKSTLLRCLASLEQPTSGTIEFQGRASSIDLQGYRKQIGMVFQHFPLFSSRTAGENIGYPLEIHGLTEEKKNRRIDELLALIGLSCKKDNYPTQLSGGEKQRIAIARALANHPQLLLCDEPTSALDPQTTQSILQLLLKLNRTLGLTIIIITHQLDVIKQICSRVAVLSKGTIVEEGDVADIINYPAHKITRELLLHKDAVKEVCA